MNKEDKPIKEKCKYCGEDIIYKPTTIMPFYTDYMHVRTHTILFLCLALLCKTYIRTLCFHFPYFYTDYMHVRTHRKKCDLKDTTEWAEPYEDSIS